MKNYKKIKIDNFKFRINQEFTPQWLEKLIASLQLLPKVPYATNRSRAYVELSENNSVPRAFVKTYAHTDCQSRGFRRTNPLRRLLPRYAFKEGTAYIKFQRLGLRVPKLLAFGEEWKFGVRHRGVLIVEALEGPSLQTLLHETRDHEGIDRIFETITEIHLAGRTHGDAHLVNFIKSNDKIYAIDIDKSKTISEKGRVTDLINIMAGIFLEVDDRSRVKEGLIRYESAGLTLSLRKEELISMARKKSLEIDDTDKFRYYGCKPQLIRI